MRRYFPLLLVLALLGSSAASPAAFAASSPPVPPTFPPPTLRAVHPEEEAEEEEFEIEECEAGEEFEFGAEEEVGAEEFELEAEECGEEEAKKGGQSFVTAPAACLVRQAESTIATQPGSDRVQLTVRYRTSAPAAVAIGLKLKDHKGTLELEHTTRHLGATGVLHLTTQVGEAVMERVEKAKEFDVSLRAAGTPAYCGALLEQNLRPGGGGHRAGASRVRGN